MKLYLSSCCEADIIWGDFRVNEMNLNEYAFRVARCTNCSYRWIEEFKFNDNRAYHSSYEEDIHNENYR